MNKTNWFNKIGKLLLIFLALLTALTIFLPVIALPNEVAALVNYKGIDVVFGKEIGMILFSGVYYSNAIINPSIMLFLGFFLPLFVTIITSLLIKNRRVVGFSCAISFVISIIMLLMVKEIGSCYLANTNLLTGLKKLTKKSNAYQTSTISHGRAVRHLRNSSKDVRNTPRDLQCVLSSIPCPIPSVTTRKTQ